MDKTLKTVICLVVASLIFYLVYRIVKLLITYSETTSALSKSINNSNYCNTQRCIPTASQLVEVLPITITTSEYQNDVAKYSSLIVYSIENGGETKTAPLYPAALTIVKELYTYSGDPVFGVIATTDNTIWISFRGSFSYTDWKQDLEYKQEPLCLNSDFQFAQPTCPYGKIHSGFANVYMTFRKELLESLALINPGTKNIIISGHSLGAAVATLVGVDLAQFGYTNIAVYNFASPYVGDESFKELVDDTLKLPVYRIVNTCDIVPVLPLSVSPNFLDNSKPYIYVHCGIAKSFQKNRLSIVNNHLIPVYMEGLQDFDTSPIN